jgi:hypothetical protein
MIRKVSEQNTYNKEFDFAPVERKSIYQDSMDSFQKVVVSMAQDMINKNQPIEEVAKKFNMSTDFLNSLLNPKTAVSCDCVNKTASTEESQDPLSNAQKAYESLYGAKTVHNQEVMSKRILGSHEKDTGGVFTGSRSLANNNIFQEDNIEKFSKIKHNDEILKENNKKIAQTREEKRELSYRFGIDEKSVLENLKNVNTTKSADAIGLHGKESYNYNNLTPKNGISIFDTKEFERVPEKTASEVVKDNNKIKRDAPKSRDWAEDGKKSSKSSSIVDNMINSMLGKNNG